MSTNKIDYKKRVKVTTPKGDRYLSYYQVSKLEVDGIEISGSDCAKQCPYGKLCEFFPDPRNPEDENFGFCDFCSDLGTESLTQENFTCYVPEEGTIENNLGDVFPKITEIILEKNPLIRLNKLIDSVCKGVCGDYNELHTNCEFANSFCLFRNLFVGSKASSEQTEDVLTENQQYETDREPTVAPSPFIEIE